MSWAGSSFPDSAHRHPAHHVERTARFVIGGRKRGHRQTAWPTTAPVGLSLM